MYASISVTMTWMHRTTVFLEDEPDEIRIVITTVFAEWTQRKSFHSSSETKTSSPHRYCFRLFTLEDMLCTS